MMLKVIGLSIGAKYVEVKGGLTSIAFFDVKLDLHFNSMHAMESPLDYLVLFL